MSEYTPSREEARREWVGRNHGDPAMYDRFIAEIQAEAWDEGRLFAIRRATLISEEVAKMQNPYRDGAA